MSTELIINASLPETRIALMENGQLVAIDIGSSKIKAVIGEWDDQKKLRIL